MFRKQQHWQMAWANRQTLAYGPLVLAILTVFTMLMTLKGWTWHLFDDIGWKYVMDQHRGWIDWVQSDFINNGRFRPFTYLLAKSRLLLTGESPRLIRVQTFLEWTVLLALVHAFVNRFTKQEPLSFLFSLLAVTFLVKSPPVLELLEYHTLTELPATLFVLLALLLWESHWRWSIAILLVATWTKEPFCLFLALPPLFYAKSWKEVRAALLAILVASAFVVFLYGHSKAAGYYQVGVAGHTVREILLKLAIDIGPLIFVLALSARRWLDYRFRAQRWMWQCTVLVAFALVYAGFLSGKASGYTYHFAPSVVLLAMALGIKVANLNKQKMFNAVTLTGMLLLILVQPARLVWNRARSYERSLARYELLEAIGRLPKGVRQINAIATNCFIDTRGLGYLQGMSEVNDCDHRTFQDCCSRAQFVAYLEDCPLPGPDPESWRRTLQVSPLERGNRWALVACR